MSDAPEKALLDAQRTAMAILQSQEVISDEVIDQAIDGALASIAAMRLVYGDVELDRTMLRRHIEERVTVWTAEQTSLSDDRDHVPWLENERAEIHWRFWERYHAYIADDLSPAAVKQVNRITDDVLGRLESPRRDGAWDRRGMVVGQVQSGKTGNYTGLICKAADAGYRLIVVLAGLHDSLRSQTQERIDEGFLGWDTQYGLTHKDGARSHRTGVGAMVQNARLLPAATYTSSAPKGDFKRQVAQQVAPHIGSDPVVLVIKKHKTILENLIAWTTREAVTDPLTGRQMVMDQPILVIDDEADNASINTNPRNTERRDGAGDPDDDDDPETDPTAINRLIRQLLAGFQKSAYVGYTATPFANIFIYEDEEHSQYGPDLFPTSFIVRIPPPSNYVGAARVFGLPAAETPDGVAAPPLPIIREVDDWEGFIENPKSKDSAVGALPPSLREAVLSFVLVGAARLARDEPVKHNSMLVHVTRFVRVQELVTERITDEMDSIRLRLRHGEGASETTVEDELRVLWEHDFEPTSRLMEPPDAGARLVWDNIRPHLSTAASRIVVRAVNGEAADALTYKDHRATGLNVIAIGGNKLSRGLTLEGLTVSYYLRTTKMYDTLMQMGRWFGYRPGYLDLCRLYTTAELVDWYQDITVANEELNREFAAMASAELTPRDYGLRVRSHPEGLLVTARTKMRNAKEMQLSFAGVCPQTTAFELRADRQTTNVELTSGFLRQHTALGRLQTERTQGAHMWSAVPGSEVARFLEQFLVAPGSRRVNGPLLSRYILECVGAGELLSWTVGLISRADREGERMTLADQPIGMIERQARVYRPDADAPITFSVQSIMSQRDELLDLTPNQVDHARADTMRRFDAGALKTRSGEPPSGPDGISARAQRGAQSGLLLLYPIEAGHQKLDSTIPLIGLAVSFPKSRDNRSISYRVNNVYAQMELGLE